MSAVICRLGCHLLCGDQLSWIEWFQTFEIEGPPEIDAMEASIKFGVIRNSNLNSLCHVTVSRGEHFCGITRLAFVFPYSIVILCAVGVLVLTLTFTLHPSPFTLHPSPSPSHTTHTSCLRSIHAQNPLARRARQGAAHPCVMLAELSSRGERNRKYRWSLDARNQYPPD